LEKNHGRGLLGRFQESPQAIVRSVLTEHEFLPWLFRKIPHGYFEIRENRKRYVEWLKDKLGLETMDQLKFDHYLKWNGTQLLNIYNGSPQSILDSLQSDGKNPSSPYNRARVPVKHWVRLTLSVSFTSIPE
jgi:hypothetical protein